MPGQPACQTSGASCTSGVRRGKNNPPRFNCNKSNCPCCLPLLLFAFWRGSCSQCWIQGDMVAFSVEEVLHALLSPEEGEKWMKGTLEEGGPATSHKCVVFFSGKSFTSESVRFMLFLFCHLPLCLSPSCCLSKQTHKDFSFSSSLAASPSVCLFVCSCWVFFP